MLVFTGGGEGHTPWCDANISAAGATARTVVVPAAEAAEVARSTLEVSTTAGAA